MLRYCYGNKTSLTSCWRTFSQLFILSENQINLKVFKRFYSAEKCWKCGLEQKTAQFFCEECNSLQNPKEKQNYFKIFDVEAKYDVDLTALRNKYRKMQSLVHPDKFSNKSSEEKAISEEYSALLNKAFNSLNSPLGRALHLLALHGGRIEEDAKVDSAEFLMEIMELNEEVESVQSAEEIKALNAKNNQKLNNLSAEISKLFESNEIEKAKEILVKMKYFDSLSKRINSLIRERGIE